MRRQDLEHALRAAAGIVNDYTILIIGSQSILASYSESELPPEATASREVDLAFFNDPDGRKADLVEGSIGEDSPFDQSFGFYVDGVDTTTATLPHGWWLRLVDIENANTGGAKGQALEPHDCVVSKLVAGREKDYAFAAALLRAGLVHVDVLIERVRQTELDPNLRRRILDWLGSLRG